MQYVKARESADEEAALWRQYVADSLFLQTQNKCFTVSFSDLLQRIDARNSQPAQKVRTADDVAADIIRRHGIKFERKE